MKTILMLLLVLSSSLALAENYIGLHSGFPNFLGVQLGTHPAVNGFGIRANANLVFASVDGYYRWVPDPSGSIYAGLGLGYAWVLGSLGLHGLAGFEARLSPGVGFFLEYSPFLLRGPASNTQVVLVIVLLMNVQLGFNFYF